MEKECLIYADKEDVKKVILNILISSIINSDKNSNIVIKTQNTEDKVHTVIKCQNNIRYLNINSEYTALGDKTRMYYCRKIIEANSGSILFNQNIPDTLTLELPQNNAIQIQLCIFANSQPQ